VMLVISFGVLALGVACKPSPDPITPTATATSTSTGTASGTTTSAQPSPTSTPTAQATQTATATVAAPVARGTLPAIVIQVVSAVGGNLDALWPLIKYRNVPCLDPRTIPGGQGPVFGDGMPICGKSEAAGTPRSVHPVGYCHPIELTRGALEAATREALARTGTRLVAVAQIPQSSSSSVVAGKYVVIFGTTEAMEVTAFYLDDSSILKTQLGCNSANSLLRADWNGGPVARYALP
jgi:hypothetical protein